MNEKIKELYIESNHIENTYNELLKVYMANGFEIEDLTKGKFQVATTLDFNLMSLRVMILESDLCKEIELIKPDYTFSDLKAYASEYGLNHDTTLIDKIIQQYEMTEQLCKLEERNISKIAFDLKSIIGENIMSKYNQNGTIRQDGQVVIKEEEKTKEELTTDHKKALMKAEELYVNEGELSGTSYTQTVNMINKVFNNYIYGNKKIPVEEFRMLKQSNECNNTTSHVL